jgi:hypothetical protein
MANVMVDVVDVVTDDITVADLKAVNTVEDPVVLAISSNLLKAALVHRSLSRTAQN